MDVREFSTTRTLLIGISALLLGALCWFLVFGSPWGNSNAPLERLKVTISASPEGIFIRYVAGLDSLRQEVKRGLAFPLPKTYAPFSNEEVSYGEASAERIDLRARSTRLLNVEIEDKGDPLFARLHDGNPLAPGLYEFRMNLNVRMPEAAPVDSFEQFAWPIPSVGAREGTIVEFEPPTAETIEAQLRFFKRVKGPKNEDALAESDRLTFEEVRSDQGKRVLRVQYRRDVSNLRVMFVSRWKP